MRNIFILLTRSQTVLSRVIRRATGDTYTHVSIACDDELQTLCSFARRRAALPVPAGLVRESLQGGYFELHRYMPCALLCLPAQESAYGAVRARVEAMLASRERYRYDYGGLIRCRLGVPGGPPDRYFCSRFVAEVLGEAGALALPKEPSLMRPQDFMNLPEVTCVYTGWLSGLMHTPAVPRRGAARAKCPAAGAAL